MERFFKQAWVTAIVMGAKPDDIIDAYNGKVNSDGICPTITTRPEGFKTAILVVMDGNNKTVRSL